jgi:hypothetical protein
MYRFRSGAIFLLALLTLAVMAAPAYSATITTYTSSASWLAATTGDQLDNFEGLGTPGTFTVTGPIFQNGVEFVGLSGSTGIADTTTFSWSNFGTGEAGFVAFGTNVQITIPTPVTAFSINLFTNPAATTYTVTALSTPFTFQLRLPTPAFFGSRPIRRSRTIDVQIPTGGTYTFFDNFEWGTAQTGGGSQVPEAGTFLMIGTGLVGFAIFRHKVRRPQD